MFEILHTRTSLALLSFILLVSCGQISYDDVSHEQSVKPKEASPAKDKLHQAAQEVIVKVKINHNYQSNNCPNNQASCYHATMNIQLAKTMPTNWRIVFSNLSPISSSQSEAFAISHMNGDLHQITAITALKGGQTYSIDFMGNTPLVSESVLFPNYLLVDEQGRSQVIESTNEVKEEGYQLARPQHIMPFTEIQQLLRGEADKIETLNARKRYLRDQALPVKTVVQNAISRDITHRIIPSVENASWSGDYLDISHGVNLPSPWRDNAFLLDRFDALGITTSNQGIPVHMQNEPALSAQSYRLEVRKDSINIISADSAGAHYALMTLAQLFDSLQQTFPIGKVTDRPILEFRGLHLDVARNFRDKDYVLQLLDQMAYFKLNKLHLHLADDEAWRLEIPSLPELTEIGAKRCFDETEQQCLMPQLAGGLKKDAATKEYYSTADYQLILTAAQSRHIEIIPSLDMPGHSRAAIVSMLARYNRYTLEEDSVKAEQYLLSEFDDESQYSSIQHYSDNTLNPCLASTYTFIEEVLAQLRNIHDRAGAELRRYHIGADETAGAWKDSPACKKLIGSTEGLESADQIGPYFIEKVARLLNSLNIMPAAWSDGLSHVAVDKLPLKVHSNAWGTLYSGAHNYIHQMVNQDWDVILSLPDVLYFDFPYEADPIEPGYYWGSRYTNSYQVFQFMPFNLPVHAELWKDNFGRDYETTQTTNLQNNKAIHGIQAQLWSETVRSDEQANYMLFPRLLAFAERAWHKPSWAEAYSPDTSYASDSKHFDESQRAQMQADWANFTHLLATKAMVQLVADGVTPRVPLPGGAIIDNKLHMTSEYDGLVLEYKMQGEGWQQYQQPIAAKLPLQIRARIDGSETSSRYQIIQN